MFPLFVIPTINCGSGVQTTPLKLSAGVGVGVDEGVISPNRPCRFVGAGVGEGISVGVRVRVRVGAGVGVRVRMDEVC